MKWNEISCTVYGRKEPTNSRVQCMLISVALYVHSPFCRVSSFYCRHFKISRCVSTTNPKVLWKKNDNFCHAKKAGNRSCNHSPRQDGMPRRFCTAVCRKGALQRTQMTFLLLYCIHEQKNLKKTTMQNKLRLWLLITSRYIFIFIIGQANFKRNREAHIFHKFQQFIH